MADSRSTANDIQIFDDENYNLQNQQGVGRNQVSQSVYLQDDIFASSLSKMNKQKEKHRKIELAGYQNVKSKVGRNTVTLNKSNKKIMALQASDNKKRNEYKMMMDSVNNELRTSVQKRLSIQNLSQLAADPKQNKNLLSL